MNTLTGLRVCHVASGDLWAGAEVQVATLLSEFKKDPSLDVCAVLLNKGVLYERLTALGISTQVLDECELNSVEIARQLYFLTKNWRPHVVHTHRYKENCLGGLAASCAKVPVIVHTVHGIHEALAGWENIKWEVYSMVARQVTRRVASGLIGVSIEIASILRKQFPNMEVACIHNGIQRDAVTEMVETGITRERIGVREPAIVVGTVGRLTPVKGIEYLLKAVALLGHERVVPPVQVVIIGGGPLRTSLQELVQSLGIEERVRFLGERHDVQRLLSLLDVFIMPSLHEGIPMALLEAMAAGCPVIATAVGGVPEVVRDGRDGMLVPPRDPVALARAIEVLHASQSLRERFGSAGPERVAIEFSAGRMASRTKEFYLSLVKQS